MVPKLKIWYSNKKYWYQIKLKMLHNLKIISN